jgi:undecaprenyl pyrophosphate phosphatase UppP
MRKFSFALCAVLFGGTSAIAHHGHDNIPHFHLTESVSIGIGVIVAITLSVITYYFIKKKVKKKNYAK